MTATAPAPSTGTARVPQTWACRLDGHDYELDVTPGFSTRLVLRVDGEQLHESTESGDRRTIGISDGRRVEVRISTTGSVRRATVHDGGADLDFDAPAGSRAARTQAWARQHSTLFALRLLGIKLGAWAVTLLGLGALVRYLVAPLLEWVRDRLPRIDLSLPTVDLPQIPWPALDLRIPWPQITPPEWLVTFFERIEPHEGLIKAVLIGLILAAVEARRLRRQQRVRASAGSVNGTSGATPLARCHT